MVSTSSQVWILLFLIWGSVVSGVFTPIFGTPGFIQVVQLKKLYNSREARVSSLEKEISKLDAEREKLESNSYFQVHEIRKVLGFSGPTETVFEFSEPVSAFTARR